MAARRCEQWEKSAGGKVPGNFVMTMLVMNQVLILVLGCVITRRTHLAVGARRA